MTIERYQNVIGRYQMTIGRYQMTIERTSPLNPLSEGEGEGLNDS